LSLQIVFEALLTVFWAFLFAYFIPRWNYFKQSGLSVRWLRGLFIAKVGMGILYGYVHWYVYGGSDTWNYMRFSRMIYDTLFINPLYYLELVFGPNARRPPDYLCEIVEPIMHWSDVRTYTVLRVNALVHLVSGGYYGVHAVFFAFFSYIGLVGIYKMLRGSLNRAAENIVFTVPFWATFGIPSVWFWSSGVHKEALSVFGIGLFLFYMGQLIEKTGNYWRNRLIIGLSIAFLLLLRPYIVMLLFPCSVAWYLLKRKEISHIYWGFAIIYTVCMLLTILLPYVQPKLNLFAKIVDIQYYYITYSGGVSDLKVPKLQPNFTTICSQAPLAIYNVLIAPLFGRVSNPILYLFTLLENVVFLCLMVLSLARLLLGAMGAKLQNWLNPTNGALKQWLLPLIFDRLLWLYCLSFALSYTLLIGLINDNIGAIVRYRSTILIFWVAACCLPFSKNGATKQ
jgi:hypothetical protein